MRAFHRVLTMAVVVAAGFTGSVWAVPTPVLIDNSGVGYSTVAWSEQGGVGDAFNSTQGFNSASGNTGASATYTFTGLDPGKQYNVFSTWRQPGQVNVSTTVPYTLSDGGGVVVVNQQAASGPANNLIVRDTDNSGTLYFDFQHLGIVTEGGNGTITASIGVTSGFVLSDAVLVAEVANLTIIDNGDAGFAQVGFTGQGSRVEAFSGDDMFNSAPNNGASATWTFNGLQAGTYEVYVTSDQDGQVNLSTVAPFTVSDGGGLFQVNQRVGPALDLIAADLDGLGVSFFGFQRLTTLTVLDGQLQVRLDAVAGGGASDFVFADAVAIRQVSVVVPEPATATLGLLSLGGLMMRRRRMA